MTTTIDTLARTLCGSYGIGTLNAARDAVRAYVDQLADDADMWDRRTDTLTDAGVRVVTRAIADHYAQS